jgi:hypothetical protein
MHEFHQLIRDDRSAQSCAYERSSTVGGQPAHMYFLDHPLSEQLTHGGLERMLATDLHVAIGAQDQHAAGVKMSSEEQEEAQTRDVRPVEVVYQQYERIDLGESAQEVGRCAEKPQLALSAVRFVWARWNEFRDQVGQFWPLSWCSDLECGGSRIERGS